MKRLTIDELKEYEFNVLKVFRNFCEKNHLKYYLAYGTLIGAVRHKGFIPWDDDIDILMPRKDYDYVIKHFNEEKIGNYEAVSKEIYPDFYANFMKIIDRNTSIIENGETFEIGAWIDIFPLDFATEKVLYRKIQNKLAKLDYKLAYIADLKPTKTRTKFNNFLIRIINIFFPFKNFFHKKRLKRFSHIVSKEKTSTYIVPNGRVGENDILYQPVSAFEPAIKMEFEGEMFDVPKEYHNILTADYGDYMVLPPVEKRKVHSPICYLKDGTK